MLRNGRCQRAEIQKLSVNFASPDRDLPGTRLKCSDATLSPQYPIDLFLRARFAAAVPHWGHVNAAPSARPADPAARLRRGRRAVQRGALRPDGGGLRGARLDGEPAGSRAGVL